MASLIQDNFRMRKSFAKESLVEIPNLIEIQKRSYDKFLQLGVDPAKREDTGLQAVFKRVFPIKDFNESASLDFVKYDIDPPKYDVDECHSRGMTYAAPMKVSIRLIVWEKDEVTGKQTKICPAAELYRRGVPFALDVSTGQAGADRYPWWQMATLMRNGIDRATALQSLTTVPAKILGLDAELGSLQVGKRASLQILTGDPLAATTWVDEVLVDGELVYERSKDPRLQHLFGVSQETDK